MQTNGKLMMEFSMLLRFFIDIMENKRKFRADPDPLSGATALAIRAMLKTNQKVWLLSIIK